jgi:hypothetical protein
LHSMMYEGSGKRLTDPVYYILVCKVVLGKTAITTKIPILRGSPLDDSDRKLLLPSRRDLVPVPGSRKVHYHSLLADISTLRYREFISFHSERIRPVYLVAYTRGAEATGTVDL